jgi:isoleucyl-tRNA synthetase
MSTDAPKIDYKATLNLPKTDFPMKADLVKNEPARLAKWKAADLYAKVQAAHAHDPMFVLHDGPPFANGDIHIGHVINKTLKDVVIKYKTMAGHRTPYVPGWDCHGLPIEHKIQEEIGPKWREMEPLAIREKCYASAADFIGRQSEQFQRLGILGNWAEPYATMAPSYEAGSLEVFARFVEQGLVYKQLKPVTWSIENGTALADAELEYKDVTDNTVFVEFPSANPGALKAKFDVRVNAKVNFVIWTTTPWTLPANLAIAAGPDVDYAFVQYEHEGEVRVDVIAVDLVEKVFARRSASTPHSTLATAKGRDLEGLEYLHPFADRTGKVLLAEYVTTTDGTGLVHTAPGHGEEDYETGNKYGLDVYCPVQANGKYDSTVPSWLAGLNVWQANPIIVEKLKELGVLFASEKYTHSYPHDWRSKKPTITRATEQWFIAVDKPFHLRGDYGGSAGAPRSIRQRGLEAAKRDVAFYPDWGRARLTGMLESRPDWCVSRQRAWGLPIPVFYNEAGDALITPQSVRAVAATFAKHGSNAWFSMTPAQLLGEDFDSGENFPLATLRKERDIFDVWFESGSSWFSVVEARHQELGHVPVDLYLEGSDQHRGWFQLSSLTALGVTGNPPFKAVLTHGFAVKPDGTKVSKADKEYVKAVDEINRHGADVLRLWVCSIDYQGDMPVSPKVITDFGDKYRKLRNTIRYLLSNIDDFDPWQHSVPIVEHSLDRWMMNELGNLTTAVREAYDAYKFHIAFRLLHDFCAVQISSLYGNAMKDRLYCERADSPIRRRAQLVMYECATTLIQLLAPMCAFTADEAWEFLKVRPQQVDNVHLSTLPKPHSTTVVEPEIFMVLMKLRDEALLQLDGLKKSSGLNKAGEAEIVYHVKDEATKAALAAFGVDLEDLVGCGYHSIVVDPPVGDEPKVTVVDRRTNYALCARSWKRRPDVGSDPAYPDLSKRDADAVAHAK